MPALPRAGTSAPGRHALLPNTRFISMSCLNSQGEADPTKPARGFRGGKTPWQPLVGTLSLFFGVVMLDTHPFSTI